MKKVLTISLVITLIVLCVSQINCSFSEDANTEYTISINGVNVALVDGKTVLDPIEKDGIVYVPLEALLKVMNISYELKDTTYTISTFAKEEMPTATSTPTASPKPTATPKNTSNMPSKEKKFMTLFAKKLGIYTFPATVVINKVYDCKDSDTNYFIQTTSKNALNMDVTSWFYLYAKSTGSYFMEKRSSDPVAINAVDKKYQYDIELLNIALTEEIKRQGY
ncbi:MAG: hypothetical protein IKE15_11415 [Clostridia bacterium]|nr:hypothetical protein [Clostridia bacterium]